MAFENYVKFVRGTPLAYEKATKYDDTLYFIHDADANEGSLYLGTKLIAGSGANFLYELNDVYIDQDTAIEAGSLLSYDVDSQKWVVTDIETLLAEVPALKDIQIFEGVASKGEDHMAAIARAVAGAECRNGDIAIVQEPLTDDINITTSYIYKNGSWKALNDNRNTEDVYLSFERNGAFPLDKSALFTSKEAAEEYAAGEGELGASAYVGQIISVNDSENNIVSGYIIAADRSLKPLGSVVVGDEVSIESENDTFSLKDYGKRYYVYIPAQKDAEGNVLIEAHYELKEVNDTYPWKSGLEPRVVLENNKLVLGWFEPNPTTIEGVNNQVGALQTDIEDLKNTLTDLTAEVGDPASEGVAATGLYAELDKKANSSDVYTKEQVVALVDNKIATVDHLKRKIVGSLSEALTFIESNPDTADQYIYMIPVDPALEKDSYDEYMVVEGVLEKVGSWETDLSGYVTDTALTETLQDYVLSSTYTGDITTINTNLANKVEKVEGSRLMTEAEGQKLAGLENSLIKDVDDNYFNVDDNGLLTFKSDNLDLSNNSSITSLSTRLNTLSGDVEALKTKVANNENAITALQESEATLRETIASHTTKIETNETNIATALNNISALETTVNNNQTTLLTKLNDYVLKETYEADMETVMNAITWHNLNDDGTES